MASINFIFWVMIPNVAQPRGAASPPLHPKNILHTQLKSTWNMK